MNVQPIVSLEVVDPRLRYALCAGPNRIYTYAQLTGSGQPGPLSLGWKQEGWHCLNDFMTQKGKRQEWEFISNPEALAEYFRAWTETEAGRSILFSMCCVCGDHALALALGQAGHPVSHGYCETCLAALEKEIAESKGGAK